MTTIADVYRGDSLQFLVAVTDSDGIAIDLSNASARYALSRSPDLAALVEKSSATVGEINLLVDGVVEINLEPADTSALVEGTYYQELELITDDAETITALAEYIRIRGTVIT